MFEPLPTPFNFPEAEKRVLAFWKQHDVFRRSLEQRRGAPRFVFYEGPPTANGLPHPGHCLTRAIKDLFPRYQTMCGKLVERKAGWDTHGLPVEVEVCKELGIHTKEEIEAFGVEKFIRKCIESVFRYTREWEEVTDRLGFWLNLEDAYATFHQSYVESVWWSLKTLFERGLLYQGHKIVWWWCQGGTALSAGEVGEGYRTVEDPAVYVRFPLVDGGLLGKGSIGVSPVREGSIGVPPASKQGSIGVSPASKQGSIGVSPASKQGSIGVSPVPASQPAKRTAVHEQLIKRRRILPHWEVGGSAYFMTFRLQSGELSPVERTLVLGACRHFDADRYLLHAAVIMPDHVHLLWTPLERSPGEWWSIADLAHSIKGFTAKAVNTARATAGIVWQREYYDRIIRNQADFDEKWNYIVTNPQRRGLPEDYPWVWVERSYADTHRRDADAPHRVSLLVWTTTPWTLVSNHFAAVGPDIDYSLVHDQTTDEYLYIATALVGVTAEKVKHKLEVVANCKGSDLIGLRYAPPFDCYHASMADQRAELKAGGEEVVGWRVTPATFVTLDTGTGLVHEAPAFGEVDFDLLQQERQRFVDFDAIPLINAVAPDGTFTTEAPEKYRGRWVKDCDKEIMRELKERGLLYHQEMYKHEYPFCPRAEDDPLIQYARKSWFVRTSEFKDEFLKNNAAVNWLPEHIKEGRFGDFLRNNVDWALSRERYWGTPLPIWVCEKTGKMEAIGSYAELLAKPGVTDGGAWERAKAADPTLPDHLRVHKPYIDAITYDSPFTGEHGPSARMRRVPEVIDCWWDAGSMPFAQWGFPHAEGSFKTFGDRFPADFISEAIDQTRGWFYGLLAISTLLFRLGGTGVPPVVDEKAEHDPTSYASKRRIVGPDLAIRRRYLPHWEAGGSTYFITFRVRAGELAPAERELVLDAARHFDGSRYLLHAAVAMPDHIHLLMTPLEKSKGAWWPLPELLHSVKSFSAKEINRLRGHGGPVWMEEYFDRIIRSDADFNEKLQYVLTNAERRGLGAGYAWTWVEPSHTPTNGRDARTTRPGAVSANYPLPYKTCIVLGHIAGEDGNKMSKRLRNYKEPAYIFDHYGADAMRWYFFCGQAPWTSIRFQEASIRDAHREFLMRLYNVFSFFNIYANIDGFAARPTPACGHRPTVQRSELDRWIISELHRTIKFVRESMDRFENFPAAGRINQLVDALSNWYVRRSRARFWRTVQGSGFRAQDSGETAPGNPNSKFQIPKSDGDQDKWDAYHTLYGCLLTLSQLIAPFTPFFAETMYQNLVNPAAAAGSGQSKIQNPKSKIADVPLSVHLCDYPLADETLIDEQLAAEMDLVREIVSLGRAARTAAKLKVRQPLALAEIVLARPEHAEWLAAHADLIADELNIKQVEFTPEADHYVTYQVKPEFKVLGPKFGKLAPQIAAALATVDAADARRTLSAAGELVVHVDGQPVRLTDHEVHVRLEAKPGWSATQGRAGVVVVKTELTPELIEEGLIREVIHHVQGLRKDLNLPYEARITLYVEADAGLQRVMARFADTVKHECLADEIVLGAPPSGAVHEAKIEGHPAKLAVVPR